MKANSLEHPLEVIRRHTAVNRIQTYLEGKEVWLILLALTVLAALLSPKFLTPLNIANLLKQSSIIGVLAIAQFLVILSGGFDLSVAGVLALSSLITARFADNGIFLAIAGALLAGALLGSINGLAVTKGRVPPLIATLAMLGIARGLAFTVSDKSILINEPAVRTLGNTVIGYIPFPAWVWFAIAATVYAFLRLSRSGLYIYAVGGREDTARLAGINVPRIKLMVYTIAGLLSAVGGVLFVTRSGSGVPHVGVGWELDTIAAVVIGGSNLFGGEGSLPKAVAGTLIYMMIRNMMNLLGLDPYFQDIFKALIILAAVALGLARSKQEA